MIAPYNRELEQPPAQDASGMVLATEKAYDLRARGAERLMPQRGPN